MRPFYALFLPLALFLLISCEKELSYEGGAVSPPPPVVPPVVPPVELTEEEKFKQVLFDGEFQLRDFYSEVPIDYNERDGQVILETDLWHYVIGYLKDDANTFSASSENVVIAQNQEKKSGLPDETITRNYAVGTDDNGLYLTFLDYKYEPLPYRVHEFGDDYFILSVEWKDGIKLFSRFERVL